MGNKKAHKKRYPDVSKDNYLPLLVAKDLKEKIEIFKSLFKKEVFDNMDYLLSAQCSDFYRKKILENNANIQLIQNFLKSDYGKHFTRSSLAKELLRINKIYLPISRWEQNKQVFQFDNTFICELINTENIEFAKSTWDFLPFDDLYIDLSRCKDLNIFSDKPEGIFLSVRKMNTENLSPGEKKTFVFTASQSGANDITDATSEIYSVDITFAFKDTSTVGWNILFENKDKKYGKNGIPFVSTVLSTDGTSEDMKITQKFVLQILNYLSSEKPEVIQSSETKHSYHKRSAKTNPKLKFSEIQKWEVGYRYGAAFRKWSAQIEKNTDSNLSEKTHLGKSVKPHYRKAHWHFYWYGKKDSSERIKRAVWISTVAVNMDKVKRTELPAVIHRIEKKEPECKCNK